MRGRDGQTLFSIQNFDSEAGPVEHSVVPATLEVYACGLIPAFTARITSSGSSPFTFAYSSFISSLTRSANVLYTNGGSAKASCSPTTFVGTSASVFLKLPWASTTSEGGPRADEIQ